MERVPFQSSVDLACVKPIIFLTFVCISVASKPLYSRPGIVTIKGLGRIPKRMLRLSFLDSGWKHSSEMTEHTTMAPRKVDTQCCPCNLCRNLCPTWHWFFHKNYSKWVPTHPHPMNYCSQYHYRLICGCCITQLHALFPCGTWQPFFYSRNMAAPSYWGWWNNVFWW